LGFYRVIKTITPPAVKIYGGRRIYFRRSPQALAASYLPLTECVVKTESYSFTTFFTHLRPSASVTLTK
jgi:hypothetical protein